MESGTPSKTAPANPRGRSHGASQSQRAASPLPLGGPGWAGGCSGARAALMSVQRPQPAGPSLERRQEPVPTPFSFKGHRAEGGAGPTGRDSFRSKGRVIKQEGGDIFSELGPKINAELCSPPTSSAWSSSEGDSPGEGGQVACSGTALAGSLSPNLGTLSNPQRRASLPASRACFNLMFAKYESASPNL